MSKETLTVNNVDTDNSNPKGDQPMTSIVMNPPQQVAEQEIIIDPEFENLLPPKTPEEYEALKEAIRNDGGARDPIVVWKEKKILLDGHNRYRICEELKFKPPTIYRKSFWSREDAMMWVVKNQLADRRNLNSFQKVVLALKSKAIFLARAKVNQQAGVRLNPARGCVTGKEVAKLAGVKSDTVRKVERILEREKEAGVADAIDALRSGARTIDNVYQTYCVMKKDIHPLGTIFPEADADFFDRMVDGIRRKGLQEPITLYDGKILDGKIRYEACAKAGVEPRFVEYTGDDPYQFVLCKNLYRSSLPESQHATLVDAWEQSKDGGITEQMVEDLIAKWNPPAA